MGTEQFSDEKIWTVSNRKSSQRTISDMIEMEESLSMRYKHNNSKGDINVKIHFCFSLNVLMNLYGSGFATN